MDESLARWNIRDAIVQFCFEARVEDVTSCEHYFMSQQLAHFGYPNLGGASNRGEPTPCQPHTLEEMHRALVAAWDNALLDFRTRVERGDLNVSGIQTQPELREDRERIPNQWAMDLSIDPLKSVMTLRDRRYINVLVEPRGQTDLGTGAASPIPRRVSPETVGDLDDETILALLEEHAQRVIDNNSNLVAPGKISLLPIVRGKMRARARLGEMLPSWPAESEALADWIREKVELHQTPTKDTIRKMLSTEYQLLSARSTRAI